MESILGHLKRLKIRALGALRLQFVNILYYSRTTWLQASNFPRLFCLMQYPYVFFTFLNCQFTSHKLRARIFGLVGWGGGGGPFLELSKDQVVLLEMRLPKTGETVSFRHTQHMTTTLLKSSVSSHGIDLSKSTFLNETDFSFKESIRGNRRLESLKV